jgi:hypothetical protein
VLARRNAEGERLMPGRDPNKVYRSDWRRECAWEALDGIPTGVEFTVRDVWDGTYGPRSHAGFPMTYQVVRDALNAGLIETTGRDHTRQGCPRLYRRTR